MDRRKELQERAARRPLRALGLMSGTSVDGIDVALIETDGETVQVFGPAETYPYAPAQRLLIKGVFGRSTPDAETAEAERLVTEMHRLAVERFLQQHGREAGEIDIVGFHGQTIQHRPERRMTWQIGDAAALARDLRLPVVADLRQADVAAGGQGAPLVPVFHAALAAGLELPVAILNIGGVANVTWIGRDRSLLAFDTGPGNGLLDQWIRERSEHPYDRDGAISAAGRAIAPVIEAFLATDYFAKMPPKSLDARDLSITLPAGTSLEDGAATHAQAVAAAVAAASRHFLEPAMRWVVCGGGAHNATIMRLLADALGKPVQRASDLGWNGDALEAQAFAFLGVRSLRGLPLTFPGTTGCLSPLAGGVLHLP